MRRNPRRNSYDLNCALAEAWDEGRRAAVVEMTERLSHMWADEPERVPIPNPYRTLQELGEEPHYPA